MFALDAATADKSAERAGSERFAEMRRAAMTFASAVSADDTALAASRLARFVERPARAVDEAAASLVDVIGKELRAFDRVPRNSSPLSRADHKENAMTIPDVNYLLQHIDEVASAVARQLPLSMAVMQQFLIAGRAARRRAVLAKSTVRSMTLQCMLMLVRAISCEC